MIRILPREIAEKIAAGEVVERPASVIKELVENSIDAGATQITISIEDGGKKKIQIQDDGSGIPEGEVLIALERHATSKIQSIDDLWKIKTMGFRGEALPSIATISRFTLFTRTESEPTGGVQVYLEGGKLFRKDPLDAKSPLLSKFGTTVSVEDLFFNVPARLKFLKAKSSEVTAIRELLERIALCHPSISFSYFSDGRKTFEVKATDMKTRVAQIIDVKPESLSPVNSHFEDISIEGFLDHNGRAPNSRYLFLSVNHRMVRDKLLQQAVMTALRPQMMEGEFPRIYLNVSVLPEDVDVNVHPAKSEVRFRRSRDVFQVIHGALSRMATEPQRTSYEIQTPYVAPRETLSATFTAREPAPASQLTQSLFASPATSYRTKNLEPSLKSEVTTKPQQTSQSFTSLQYIGQMKNTYLLFQEGDGLVVIDQHAAHERVNYEKIKSDFLKQGLKSQPLLLSITVKTKAEEIELAADFKPFFEKLGFEFEVFGEDCLILRSLPEGLASDQASLLFRALLEELKSSEEAELLVKDPSRLSPKLERVLSTTACHSSIRAGQALSPAEARALMLDMEKTPSSLNCPHGRPASVKISFSQIEAWFKR